MKIRDIARFQKENFFNGAVQLSWAAKQPSLAAEVASAFVFHGPRYHGTNTADRGEVTTSYRLKDTASFLVELLGSIDSAHSGQEVNPFRLAIAGYGAGKSHLSVTLSNLLGSPQSAVADRILSNLEQADQTIGIQARTLLSRLERPVLMLPIDGSTRFHLGNILSQTVFSQLERAGADPALVRALSPRFLTAEHFVARNYEFRRDDFATHIPRMDAEAIRVALLDQDEKTFDAVNAIYLNANGHPIPIEGQESAQDVLETLATEYCGDDGPFSHILVLFDELGLFLEHAAEHPERAGARALQEIFQGVQDNFSRIHFMGFIQYELKAYLQRFGSSDLRHLQRYLTRFDAAEKCYLSSNLETLFAHMIQKDEAALDALWGQTHAIQQIHEGWQRLSLALPGFAENPTWGDEDEFARIIARGCWPLHPLAVWLLTRQSDLIQQRSALAFVNEIITKHAHDEAVTDGHLRQVSAAELLHDFLLEQFAATDQTPGGLIETLLQLLGQRAAVLDYTMRMVMSGVAVLDKVRIGGQSRDTVNGLLAEATILSAETLQEVLGTLSNQGVLEWNEDLGQYELLADGASRGQFRQWLRIQRREILGDDIRQMFVRRGISDCGLANPIETDFGQRHEINTLDWRFEAVTAHAGTISRAIKQAMGELKEATFPDAPKGRAIYLFVDAEQDLLEIDKNIRDAFNAALTVHQQSTSPIWVIALHDTHGYLADALARLLIIDERADEGAKERFRRFINDEFDAITEKLRSASEDAIRERRYWVAGMDTPPDQRLRHTGSAIFSHVYPDVPAFPFDGFATIRSSGPKNVADLSRALVTHQVNQVWIQAQPQQLRNRLFSVLRDSWGALNNELEPFEPRNDRLRSLYEQLEQAHQEEPSRPLSTSFRWLIAPPRGLNAASATLLLCLLIGLRTPQRRLSIDGEPVSNNDWIDKAIPARGRYLEEKVLAKTTIRFFDEDCEARWIQLLNDWEAETRLDKIIERSNEALTHKELEPVPPSLLERHLRLEAASEEARATFLAMRTDLQASERQIEQAIRRSSIHYGLKQAYLLLNARAQLIASERWPAEMLSECDQLIGIANEVIQRELADNWIDRQTVHNATETQRFRERTDKEARWLESLGYTAQAAQLERQAQNAIFKVEERQRHALTLAQAEDYPRQPQPRGSEPILTLRDELKKGKDLIESIRGIDSFDNAEKDAYVGAIDRRIDDIQEAIQSQENQLGEIYTLTITSEEGLREASATVERLRNIFSGDRNEPAINELATQLSRIQQDVQAWDQGDLPAERLEEVLCHLASSQIDEFEQFVEAKWDLQEIYEHIINDKVAAVRQRSKEWMHSRLQLEAKVPELSIDRVKHLNIELGNAPAYLSADDREVLNRLLNALEKRQDKLEAEIRLARLKAWQAEFPHISTISTLGRAEVERFLSNLESPPAPLSEDELKWRHDLNNHLSQRLDEISLDDLVRRIERLSPTLRARLLKQLRTMIVE